MTKEDLDFIGSMNMCDEISNEAYKKIVCHTVQDMITHSPNNKPIPKYIRVEVLDKIRAEIADMPKLYPFTNHIDSYVKDDDVIAIIDKYKAESEE